MEEQKYFTPSIEDIRVGYEAEIAYLHEDNWSFTKWRTKEETLATITELLNYNRRIRVSYLTKEQIEAEGWTCFDDNQRHFIKNKIVVRVYFDNHTIIIGRDNGEMLFQGECKDINTFRYLIKLLEI